MKHPPVIKSIEDGEWAAYDGDKPIASAKLSIAADQADIIDIEVKEDYRRRGIGTRLLEQVLKDLSEKGVKKIFLEVRKSNTPAINFYKKFGFAQISIRRAYYGDTGEDALVMSLVLDG